MLFSPGDAVCLSRNMRVELAASIGELTYRLIFEIRINQRKNVIAVDA